MTHMMMKRLLNRIGFGFVVTALLLAASEAAPADVTLVEAGEPRAVIVLPDEPDERVRRAADELVEHIRLISGGELPVRAPLDDREGGLLPIHLDAAADEALDEHNLDAKDNPSTFTLRVRADRIDIRGLSGEGTLFGALELLEQLGVRWYMPGEIGRVIPDKDTLTLETQRTTQAPSMNYRRLQKVETGTWPARVRLGGAARPTGAHNLPGKADDQRGTEGKQVCVSGHFNPGALEMTIDWIRERHEPTDEKFYVSMGPRDGGTYAYCRCEGCQALDMGVHDPFLNAESMTDRYIWFFNRVLEALEEDYPNLHITWYVYQRHMMPPEREPNPRIVAVFAPITLDRVHSMDNPMSMDRQVLRWVMDRWERTGLNEMYYRGYLNFLAGVQLPKTQLDRVRNDIPALHEAGVNVMRVEVIQHAWASDPLTLYVATRLMWDVDTDVDALLEEFYTKFYGPAREPMKQYHERLESAFADNPYASGSSFPYFPLFLDHPRRDDLRNLLERARSMVEDGSIYARRLDMLRKGYERMDLFLDMIAARNAHNYATAHEKMQAYYAITDELVANVLDGEGQGRKFYEQRMVNWRGRSETGGSYFNRFFRDAVVRGHERTVTKGDLVAGFDDEWLYRLDKQGIGEQLMLQRPGELGGVWKPIRTTSRTWGDQGFFHYRGDDARMWYRQSVHVPEKYEGRPVYLWIGGVDTRARVWINGEFVGTSAEPKEGLPGVPGSFRPFDMPATKAVNFGEQNWVVMEIVNDKLGELGTGGIMGPVMFWSPTDPDWRPGGTD